MPQVAPDHHQVSAHKMKLKHKVKLPQNVRTMLQKGKLNNIKQEMKKMKIKIPGISKVRWQGARKITFRTFEICCSAGTEHERQAANIFDKDMAKTVKGYWTLLNRVLLLKNADSKTLLSSWAILMQK